MPSWPTPGIYDIVGEPIRIPAGTSIRRFSFDEYGIAEWPSEASEALAEAIVLSLGCLPVLDHPDHEPLMLYGNELVPLFRTRGERAG